jgi:hypothetical protein
LLRTWADEHGSNVARASALIRGKTVFSNSSQSISIRNRTEKIKLTALTADL